MFILSHPSYVLLLAVSTQSTIVCGLRNNDTLDWQQTLYPCNRYQFCCWHLPICMYSTWDYYVSDISLCLYNIYSDSMHLYIMNAKFIMYTDIISIKHNYTNFSFWSVYNTIYYLVSVSISRRQLKMKLLSVLALCAALFIAATHASQLQEYNKPIGVACVLVNHAYVFVVISMPSKITCYNYGTLPCRLSSVLILVLMACLWINTIVLYTWDYLLLTCHCACTTSTVTPYTCMLYSTHGCQIV